MTAMPLDSLKQRFLKLGWNPRIEMICLINYSSNHNINISNTVIKNYYSAQLKNVTNLTYKSVTVINLEMQTSLRKNNFLAF